MKALLQGTQTNEEEQKYKTHKEIHVQSRETMIHEKMVTAALFIIAKNNNKKKPVANRGWS